MQAQDRVDGRRVDPHVRAGELINDPGRLRAPFEADDVLLAPPAVHRDDGHQPAARDEAHEQQPPLELRHQGGRIGRGHRPGSRATHTLAAR